MADRRFFRYFQDSTTATNIDSLPVLAPRPDHVARLLGYRLEAIFQTISYSTTATYLVDVALSVSSVPLGAWTAQVTPPSNGHLIDLYRLDGGVGRIVVEGGYLVKRIQRISPVVCRLDLPSLYVHARRIQGLNQNWNVFGWVDFEWVKVSVSKLAAVNLAWNVQLAAQT